MDHSSNTTTPVAATKGTALKRVLATAVTAALAFGGVTAIAAPASAAATGDVTGGTFSWQVSQQMKDHMSTKSVAEGASLDSTTGIFTFINGTGNVNATTGASDVSYEGSAYMSFAFGGNTVYSLRLTDPEVVVDAAGTGQIRADVDWTVGANGGGTDDVLVTTFTAGQTGTDEWTGDDTVTLTDLPQWNDVILPGSQDATDVGISDATVPIDGQSFSKDFLLAIDSGLRAHFYSTKTSAGAPTASNVKKFPAQFTATADLTSPEVTPTVVSETNAGGYVVSLAGDGFRAVTKPGDAGVYVGIAPAGGHPGFESADMAKFVVAGWVNASSIVDGKFTTTVTAPSAKLDPAVEYSLYTWQSHTHSNTTQDTETALDIDFAALERYTSTVDLALDSATVTVGDDVVATATVEGATGSVEFFDGTTSLGSADLVEGIATAPLSDLTIGAHSITAVYSGDAHYTASTSAAQQLTITKATETVALKLSRTSGTYGNLVTAAATVAATGKVAFLVDGKTAATATIVDGVAKATLSRTIAAGKHTVVASYLGSDTTNATKSTSATLTLAKATTPKVAIAGSKFKKNAAPIVTVKVSKLSNGFYPSGSIKVKVNGKVVKTVKLTESKKGILTIKLPRQKSAIKVQATFKSSSTSVVGNYSTIVKIKLK